jgi:spore coat polysaccharide biosynthesis predicted glycosyltransferase SpsG
MPWPAEVHVNVTDMAALMAECDVAIGAAGGTSWERCCLGVPTLIAVLAENQQRIAVSLDAGGAAINLGEAKLPNFKLAVADAVDWLMNSSSALSHMSIKARTITQGDGAQKVVDKMTSLSYV